MQRIMIVSNRLPVTVSEKEGRVLFKNSTGGLATGLEPMRQRYHTLWLGWPGDTSHMSAKSLSFTDTKLRQEGYHPVSLSARELDGYYTRFANTILWPLFHMLPSLLPYDLQGWDSYKQVNARFADAIVAAYHKGDIIWIHDYHLMLVPELVRERLPQATIGFFLHIPFPMPDDFRILPWREEILKGLLGADLIGFHMPAYVNAFTRSLLQILGVEAKMNAIRSEDGRTVRMGAFPLGVDVRRFEELGRASTSKMTDALNALRQSCPQAKILLAVDRLDYTKGIVHRLLAFERFLETHSDYRGRVVLIQIATTPRPGVQAIEETKRIVNEIVGRVNGRFGEPNYQPIHYLSRQFSQDELTHLYRGSDVMVVTPIRDGMNLVAKEFCASRTDHDGVLLLSEFAGASAELGEALIVNPYDMNKTAEIYAQALAMPKEERQTRMRALRGRIKLLDNRRWSESFLQSLVHAHSGAHAELPPEMLQAVPVTPGELAHWSAHHPLALCLDYDGTLVPIVSRPEQAVPSPSLLKLLAQLTKRSDLYVSIVSGRSRQDLENWLGHLPLHLFAEHGLWEKPPFKTWQMIAPDMDHTWKECIREKLTQVCLEVPGSFIEEKTQAIVWHYRQADPLLVEHKVRALQAQLIEILANTPIHVLAGKKIIEVRHSAFHKGESILTMRRILGTEYQFVGIGDDTTDEDIFRCIPENGFAVRVGEGQGLARYFLSSVEQVHQYLAILEARDNPLVCKRERSWKA